MMTLYWRILKSKRSIGKPYHVQYGNWTTTKSTFHPEDRRVWVTRYEEEYGTEQEARDAQKYPMIHGHPVVGELPKG